jgi:hypothetical protein
MQIRVLAWLFGLMVILQLGSAQEPTSSTNVECGDSIEGEFTQSTEVHDYLVPMNPGDKLRLAVLPIGDYLLTALAIWEPAGNDITYDYEVEQAPAVETGILSARGDHKIQVYNYPRSNKPNYGIHRQPSANGHAGVYTLLVSCTLKDGTVIEAGVSQ